MSAAARLTSRHKSAVAKSPAKFRGRRLSALAPPSKLPTNAGKRPLRPNSNAAAQRRQEFVIAWSYGLGAALWLATALLLAQSAPSRASASTAAFTAAQAKPLTNGVKVPDYTAAQRIVAASRMHNAAWAGRYAKINAHAATGKAEIVFLGDSITQGLDHSRAYRDAFGPWRPLNAGIASDRLEHLLWRIRHSPILAAQPKLAVLMIGVNNLALASADTIAHGVALNIREVQRQSPNTKVLLLGLLPAGREPTDPKRAKIAAVNERLARLAGGGVDFRDIGIKFLAPDGSIGKDIMADALHPTHKGYKIFVDAIRDDIVRLATRG